MNSKELALLDLLKAVDTATWCWSVKKNTIKNRKIRVDWKSALDDLCDKHEIFLLKSSKLEAILSKNFIKEINNE